MPITTIASYPLTMNGFSVHYGQANLALGGTPATDIVLSGNFTKADFDALKDQIEAAISGLQSLLNDLETAQDDRDSLRANLVDRVQMFREHTVSFLAGSRWLRAMPDTPAETASPGRFLAPLDDMADLWGKIDTSAATADFTPPLVMRDGYTQAGFQTDVQLMRDYFEAVSAAERALKLAREDRDQLLIVGRDRMGQYRLRVEAKFDETDPIRLSLPDLYPGPGSTPDAVTLTGAWDEAMLTANMSWTASDDPNLAQYQLRMTPGSTYDTDSDVVVETFGPATLATTTIQGLETPGLTATYRLYVILTTGNEKGSEDLTITRP